MRKAGLSFVLANSLFLSLFALSQSSPTPAWQAVEAALGRKGQLQADGVIKFGMPRSDLKVSVGTLSIRPTLALGAWVAFDSPGPDACLMGDLVLTGDEVAPVMARLQSGNIEITALHNHLLHESPQILYMHVFGHGDAAALAKSVKAALSLTGTPSASAASQSGDLGIDVSGIEQALGYKGRINGGVLQFSVPRSESISEEGKRIWNSMGIATALNFQPTGGGKAAVTGDFVLLAGEVNPVIRTLNHAHIAVTALHSHMLDEAPRLFFLDRKSTRLNSSHRL